MKLSELIAHVGDEHIVLQNLLDSATEVKMRKGGDTQITFLTNAINATQVALGTVEKVGLVIWLPKDRIPQAKRATARKTESSTTGET